MKGRGSVREQFQEPDDPPAACAPPPSRPPAAPPTGRLSSRTNERRGCSEPVVRRPGVRLWVVSPYALSRGSRAARERIHISCGVRAMGDEDGAWRVAVRPTRVRRPAGGVCRGWTRRRSPSWRTWRSARRGRRSFWAPRRRRRTRASCDKRAACPTTSTLAACRRCDEAQRGVHPERVGDDAPGVDVGRRASERGGLRRAAAQEDDNHIMPTRMLLRPNAESTFFRRGSDCRRRLPPYPSKGGVERVHAVASRGGTRGGGGWEVLMAERGGSAAAGGDRQRRGRGRLWRPSWRRATGRWTTCSRTCRALRLRRRGEAPCIPSSASRTVLRPRRQRCGPRPRRRFSAQERICVGWVKGIGQVF